MTDKQKTYNIIYSPERLLSFAYSQNNTIMDIAENYVENIKISQAIYPELCTLEVILRNSVDFVLKKYISETWIEDDIKNNLWLDTSEHNNC